MAYGQISDEKNIRMFARGRMSQNHNLSNYEYTTGY